MKTRNDDEMMQLIINTAMEDESIRAVVLNGSRADSSVKADCFRDFDIVYIVKDYVPYINNIEWAKRFGDIMIMQLPNSMDESTPEKECNMVFLIQFMDGTRIDLTIIDIHRYKDNGEPAVAILDKDGILPPFPAPDGSCYHINRPTYKQFYDCCNEFWWLCPYVAKGLWRGNAAYVRNVMEVYMRDMQLKLYGWYTASAHDYNIGIGKCGKLLHKYLTSEEYSLYLQTFPSAKEDEVWHSLFVMCSEFARIASIVADRMGFYVDKDIWHWQNAVSDYLHHIKELDRNALSIY